MELSLRKARKLEAKIQKFADSLPLNSSVKVRALATTEERAAALESARKIYVQTVEVQEKLILARFAIRNAISVANSAEGINALMAKRESIQALLAKSVSGLESLDLAEAEDMANAKKNSLEKGEGHRYSEASVTITLPVTIKEDLESFRKKDSDLKKTLEDVEDQLSQKNLAIKIVLEKDIVSLLQAADLL